MTNKTSPIDNLTLATANDPLRLAQPGTMGSFQVLFQAVSISSWFRGQLATWPG